MFCFAFPALPAYLALFLLPPAFHPSPFLPVARSVVRWLFPVCCSATFLFILAWAWRTLRGGRLPSLRHAEPSFLVMPLILGCCLDWFGCCVYLLPLLLICLPTYFPFTFWFCALFRLLFGSFPTDKPHTIACPMPCAYAPPVSIHDVILLLTLCAKSSLAAWQAVGEALPACREGGRWVGTVGQWDSGGDSWQQQAAPATMQPYHLCAQLTPQKCLHTAQQHVPAYHHHARWDNSLIANN